MVTDRGPGKDWVAIILAIGLSTGINCVTFAVLYDAVFSQESGLSENSTQLLVTAFGGIIGVLGSYVGYRAATGGQQQAEDAAARQAERSLDESHSDPGTFPAPERPENP